MDQPPTFTGESGVGFAVTTTGDLVCFGLSPLNNGADVVFSGNQVVAARAAERPSGRGQRGRKPTSKPSDLLPPLRCSAHGCKLVTGEEVAAR